MAITKPSTIEGDVRITGKLFPKSIDYPPGSIPSEALNTSFKTNPDQQTVVHRACHDQGFVNAIDEIRTIHVAENDETILSMTAGITLAATGDSTVTIDLKVNGVSVLTAPISISSAVAAGSLQLGTFSVDSLSMNDIVSLDINATAGTGTLPKGLFVQVSIGG